MAHISIWYILTMLINWVKPQAPRERLYPLLMGRMDDGLDVDAKLSTVKPRQGATLRSPQVVAVYRGW
jgi:hypothetical protein